MAIPSRVLSVDGLAAQVECFGVTRGVNLVLLDEPVAVGDYLLVQAGGFACEKLDEARALESLALMEQVVAAAS